MYFPSISHLYPVCDLTLSFPLPLITATTEAKKGTGENNAVSQIDSRFTLCRQELYTQTTIIPNPVVLMEQSACEHKPIDENSYRIQ